MRGERALEQRAGLEQCKAQQHRVSRHAPDAHNMSSEKTMLRISTA